MTKIGDSAFSGCSGLTSITIPNSVTSIGKMAFSNCTSLSSLTIPNSVITIGEGAFNYCIGLSSLTIPNSVISIGSGAFSGCIGLTSVTIPNSVTSIGAGAFGNCKSLTSVIIPNSVTSIEEETFEFCFNLKSVIIPNSVTSIGAFAFKSCPLTSVVIPNGVTSIGAEAFLCKLSSLTIPPSVTSIGEHAFSGELTSIKVEHENPVYDSRDNCNAIIETKSNTLILGSKNVTIPSSVTSIGAYAFDSRPLTSITIPNSVTSIGAYAFSSCPLSSITIPQSVTSIGAWAFSSCPLTSLVIPNSVTSIGAGALGHCTSLTSVIISNSVTSIEKNTFYNCTGLNSITIPNSVTSIAPYAFDKCSNVKSITCYTAFPPDFHKTSFSSISENINVFVPCESIDYYRIYWDYFDSSAFRCIEATKVQTNTSSKVTPNATSAVIVWSVESDADRFKIAVTNNGNLVFTIYINSKGQITSIDYAEGGTRGAELRAATATYNGFKYEMIGLNPDTEYEYTVTTYDINDAVLRTDTGSFKTLKEIVGINEESDNTTTLKEKLSITGKELTISGTEPSDIKIYNTTGQLVGNPVPAAGVYVVKVGDEAVKVLVK